MSFVYNKFFELLKERNITTYDLRVYNLISQAALTKIKNNDGKIDTRTLDRMCAMLECQPGDIMEFINDNPVDDEIMQKLKAKQHKTKK